MLNVIRHTILYFVLGFLGRFIEGVLEQPHCIYVEPGVTWFTLTLQASSFSGKFLAAPMCVAILLNACNKPYRNVKYYPQLHNPIELWRSFGSRWTLILGGILIATYCCYIQIEFIRQHSHRCGLIWPPDRIQTSIYAAWCVVWLADLLRRPSRQTLPVFLVFVAFTVYFGLTFGFGFTRE